MKEKSTAVITGANSGMGKASSIALARFGFRVLMLCRDRERGEQAVDEVKTASGNDDIELIVCDLASLKSIRSAAAKIKQRFDRIEVLLNNAGVTLPGYYLTEDGYELQFGVNHLGHFLLTTELLDLIQKGAPSRIINVASGAHKIGKMHFDDINLEKSFRFWKAYGRSKLANILFTYELAERLKDSGVTVNCLHPGAVATSMGVNRETGFGTMITRLLKPFFQTPEEGADTAIYLATSKDVEGITGKYFYRRKPIKSSRGSYDKTTAKKLWDISVEMTRLNPSRERLAP